MTEGSDIAVGTPERAGVATTGEEAAPAAGRARHLRLAAQGLLRAEVIWPAGIFLAALVVRLLLIAWANPNPADGRFDDSVWYDSAARSLVDGRGYVFDPTVWVTADGSRIYPGEEGTSPTALWPVGYPLTLAALYKAFGQSLVLAKLFNAVLGAGTAVLVYLIGRRAFNRRVGAAAGLLFSFLPSHVFFATLVMTEVYFTFLLTLLLFLVLIWTVGGSAPRLWQMAAIGTLTGFAAMVRGELMLFPAVLLALFLLAGRPWRQALRHLGVVLLAMAVVFTPWVVRNWVQLDAFVVGTTGMGRVLLQGHNPDADGGPSLATVVAHEAAFAHLPRPQREVEANDEAIRQAIRYALRHPFDELRLTFQRLYELFRTDNAGVAWVQSNKPRFDSITEERLLFASDAYYYGLLGLAAFAAPLWFAWREPRRMLIVLPILYYVLTYGVLFVGDTRYHFPVLPLAAILAAVGVVAVLDAGRQRGTVP